MSDHDMTLPDGGDETKPHVITDDERDLWKSKYDDCTLAEFRYVLAFCRRCNLNAWARPVYPKFRDRPGVDGHRVMELEMSIEGLRTIAHRTGQYAGNEATTFVNDDKGQLVSATAYAYRLVSGQRFMYAATVDLVDADQKAGLWKSRPKTMLGKCAEAAVLRVAFPEQLGGLYVQGELPERMGPTVRGSVPTAEDVDRNGVAPDDNTPTSKMQFTLKLIHDFSLGDPHRREAILRSMRERYPHLQSTDEIDNPPIRFYATVLYLLASEPDKYGVSVG